VPRLLLALIATACLEYDVKDVPKDTGEPLPPLPETEPQTTPPPPPAIIPVDTGEPAEPPPETTPPPPPEPDNEPPVAVCSVDPTEVEPPFEAATFYGDASFDPDGVVVKWTWSILSQPPGSGLVLPPGNDPNRGPFMPDLAGDYVAQLVVTDDDGAVSDPCVVTLASVPGQDLWIEMFWSHNDDDMDLHVVRDDGALWNNTDDCHFANCDSAPYPNWGAAGAVGNPRLDLDDIPGKGPENINIDDPGDDTYTVVVHDYALSGHTYSGDNDVTVNIYIGGVLEWSGTKTISGEDKEIPFAKLTWATGAIISL
jgi:hypothetical protein